MCVGQGERLIANGRRQANQFQSGNAAGVTRLQRRLRWHLARPKATYHNGAQMLLHTVQARTTGFLIRDLEQQP